MSQLPPEVFQAIADERYEDAIRLAIRAGFDVEIEIRPATEGSIGTITFTDLTGDEEK